MGRLNQVTDKVAILVEDLTRSVSGKTLQDADVGHLVAGLTSSFVGLFLGHLGCEFAAANEITIVVKDLSVVANGVASEVLSITLNEASDIPAIRILDHAILVNFEALEQAQVGGSVLGGVLGVVGSILSLALSVFSCVLCGALSIVSGIFSGVLCVANLGLCGVLGRLSGILSALSGVFRSFLRIFRCLLGALLNVVAGILSSSLWVLLSLTSEVRCAASETASTAQRTATCLLAGVSGLAGSLCCIVFCVVGSVLGGVFRVVSSLVCSVVVIFLIDVVVVVDWLGVGLLEFITSL